MANRKDYSNSPGRQRNARDWESMGFTKDEEAGARPVDRIQGRNSQPAGGDVKQMRRALDDAADATRTDIPQIPGYSFGTLAGGVSRPSRYAPPPSNPGPGTSGPAPSPAPTPSGPGPAPYAPSRQQPPSRPQSPQDQPPQDQEQEQPQQGGRRRKSGWEVAYDWAQAADKPFNFSETMMNTLHAVGNSMEYRRARRLGLPPPNGGPPVGRGGGDEGNGADVPNGGGGNGGGNGGGGAGLTQPIPPPTNDGGDDFDQATRTPWSTRLPVGFAVGRALSWGPRAFPKFRSAENTALMTSPGAMDPNRVHTQHAYMQPTRRQDLTKGPSLFDNNRNSEMQPRAPMEQYRPDRQVEMGGYSQYEPRQAPDWTSGSSRPQHSDPLHEMRTGNPWGFDAHTRSTAGYDTPTTTPVPGIRAPRRTE